MKQKYVNYALFGFMGVLAVTFFTRGNIRDVRIIAPEVLIQPVQTLPQNSEEIKFTRDGYEYRLMPLYDYEISGLIVSKMNYKLFSIYRFESVFPVDLCMIWGSNVEHGVHRNKDVRFFQDCRWCNVEWPGNVSFDLKEISNNHLVVSDPAVERFINNLVAGDQITIKGKLVSVKATLIKQKDSQDPKVITWTSSIQRDDRGAGACEVIYAEEIRLLKKANIVSRILFTYSFWGLIVLLGYKIINFFLGRIET
ncbi:MAG: hypothetical protein PHE58_04010 [Candidatus Omnitrophica bacterium]|nr:hypothetical protein [Candidatus Omnitrophota bacterium]